MDISSDYDNRLHTLIKHKLLESYLEKLLFIVGCGGFKRITYVDCFAGPWSNSSDSLSDTSIAISLTVMENVRERLLSPPHNKSDIEYRALYIEKNRGRYAELQSYLTASTPPGIVSDCLNGDYANMQSEILEFCADGFAFFFLDPKGWTDVAPEKFSELLNRRDSEFMITFMYDFINRAVGMAGMRPQVLSLLGDDAVVEEIASGKRPDREIDIVKSYAENLKAHMVSSPAKARAFYSTVLDKDKNRTKYHMVYLTHHPKGIVEFGRMTAKAEILQKKVRIQSRAARGGQGLLFPVEDSESGDEQIVDYDTVKEYILGKFSNTTRKFNEADLADMIEETGWLEGVFQTGFQRLIADGIVENLDMGNARKTRFVHFEKNERLRLK